MKKYFFALISACALGSSCGEDAADTARSEEQSYQFTKQNLLEKEQKSPASFLLIKGDNKKNLLGQTVVKGTITNKATVATFKDVDIKLAFYSKTNALLETDKETVFEVLPPGKSKNFKTKYFAPKGTDSVALQVLGAKVVKDPGN